MFSRYLKVSSAERRLMPSNSTECLKEVRMAREDGYRDSGRQHPLSRELEAACAGYPNVEDDGCGGGRDV